MDAGVIYILVTPTNRKLLKIGKTTRTAEERALEISNGSGVPAPYWVIYDEEVADCNKAEKLIHSRLANYRYRGNREFFELPLKEAIPVVMEVIAQVNAEFKDIDIDTDVPTRRPVIGRAAGMTQILGPSPVSISPKQGRERKIYFRNEKYEVTDRYLRYEDVIFDFQWVTSVQVFREDRDSSTRKRNYALLVNTLRRDVARSDGISDSDRGTVMEVFRLLTTAK